MGDGRRADHICRLSGLRAKIAEAVSGSLEGLWGRIRVGTMKSGQDPGRIHPKGILNPGKLLLEEGESDDLSFDTL